MLIDALIITALPRELEAAEAAGNRLGGVEWQPQTAGSLPYLAGKFGPLAIALARPVRMGPRVTGPLATTLTDLLQPRCLAMSGVCAGNPAECAPGDVIVASSAYEYDEGLQTAGGFQGDHQQYPQDTRWIRAAQDFDPTELPSFGPATEESSRIWLLERLLRGQDPRLHPARERYFPRGTWAHRLEKWAAAGLITFADGVLALTPAGGTTIRHLLARDVDGPDRLPFAVLDGPMASGSAVQRDEGVWNRLRSMGVRKLLGLEMEAATVATVAHQRHVPHWLVAKGVMDHADLSKDDRFKEFAARASAEVLFTLLSRLLPVDGTAEVPGAAKLQVLRGLIYDWHDLADLLGVPPFDVYKFTRGDEPRSLWAWLEVRGRLGEMPGALDEIGRTDLADRLR
jgi:nucleoside phosphorylase